MSVIPGTAGVLHAIDRSAQVHLDALLDERPRHDVGHRRVERREQMVLEFDDLHTTVERPERGRHLDRDRPAPDDQQ
jgi:hypothetical protein